MKKVVIMVCISCISSCFALDRVSNIEQALGYEYNVLTSEVRYKKVEKIDELEKKLNQQGALADRVFNIEQALGFVYDEVASKSYYKRIEEIDRLDTIIDSKINTSVGSKVKQLEDKIDSVISGQISVSLMSEKVSNLMNTTNDLKTRMDNIETTLNTTWVEFLERKFNEYMDTKKEVLAVIADCKARGEPKPTFITETAEQLEKGDMEVRHALLTNILSKIEVFEGLLAGEDLETVKRYMVETTVAEPILKNEIGLLSYTIEGSYLKVSGETRTFTRSSGLKTGLPKEGWMDQFSDYFPYAIRPSLDAKFNQENSSRKERNNNIRIENKAAISAYQAAISAVERVTFPTESVKNIITAYNRLLVHHDI